MCPFLEHEFIHKNRSDAVRNDALWASLGIFFFLPSCVGNRNGEVQLIDVYLADWDGRGELRGWWETDFRSWAHRWFNAAPSCLFSHSHICFAWPTIELSPFICFQAESSTWKMCLSCQRRAAAHRFLLENTNQNSYSDTLDTFCSCRFSLVKSLLILILGGGFFFRVFVFEQSSKMCTQHSPLQECGGVLHDDCNARLALMFARCAVCLRPSGNHRTGCPPPVTAGITPGKGPVFCLHSLRRTMVRQPAGDAETHFFCCCCPSDSILLTWFVHFRRWFMCKNIYLK